MKEYIKIAFVSISPIIIFFLRLFFDRRYLVGRHFEDSLDGYIWSLAAIWQRNILRLGKPMPFPVGLNCRISSGEKIEFHPDDLNNFQSPGIYIQNYLGRIRLGRGCYIAPNVGIITANHDLENLDQHQPPEDVEIGEKCWIGMNSVVLPGVILGRGTIVAAGSVVTKSFPEGNCVIAGAPAKRVRDIFQKSVAEYDHCEEI